MFDKCLITRIFLFLDEGGTIFEVTDGTQLCRCSAWHHGGWGEGVGGVLSVPLHHGKPCCVAPTPGGTAIP